MTANILHLIFQDRLLQPTPTQTPTQPSRTKAITEPDMLDQSWWTKGQVELLDNKHDKLNLDLRIRLGAINQDPRIWYPQIPASLACVTTPRRASTVYTGNIITLMELCQHNDGTKISDHVLSHSNRLHPTLIWDLHDRRSHIELARTIRKNA